LKSVFVLFWLIWVFWKNPGDFKFTIYKKISNECFFLFWEYEHYIIKFLNFGRGPTILKWAKPGNDGSALVNLKARFLRAVV